MTGPSLKFLLCYLNSSLSEFLFSKIGTKTGEGTIRWKKFKIEQLIVPRINDAQHMNIEHVGDMLLKALHNHEDIKVYENEIDQLIYSFYHITLNEQNFINKSINSDN